MRVNFAEEDPLVPEGEYAVEVEAATLRAKSGGDSYYIQIQLAILEGPHTGTVLWTVASLRADLRRMLRSTFRALGIDDEDLVIETEDPEPGHECPDVVNPNLVGRRAVATVIHDEYLGEVRAKVKRLSPMETVS